MQTYYTCITRKGFSANLAGECKELFVAEGLHVIVGDECFECWH